MRKPTCTRAKHLNAGQIMSVTTLTKPATADKRFGTVCGNKDRLQTVSEIAKACQLSGNTVYKYLIALNKGGFVSIQKGSDFADRTDTGWAGCGC